jgi:hypothetical protein
LGTTIFNADEHFWFLRTQNFISAIQKGDWAGTYQNPKPGITVMFLSGVCLETVLQVYELAFNFRPQIYTYDTFWLVSLATKLPLVLLNIVSVIGITIIIRKIFNKQLSIFFLILLVLHPYFIGISRYFHGDGTLTIFMSLSVFTLFYAIFSDKRLFLVLSGIFGGLAVLTKLQGVFLFPYLGLILLCEVFYKKLSIKDLVFWFVLWSVVFVFTIFLFFPALWVNAADTLRSIFEEAFVITSTGKNAKVNFNPYLVSFPMIVTFPSILLNICGIIAFVKSRNKYILYSMMFVFFYVIQIQLVEQKSERYLLPLFPFLALIGAYGLDYLKTYLRSVQFKWILVFVTVFNFSWLLWNTPYYTAHAELAPWGAVYFEAAKYLNSKPDAQNTKVVAVEKPHTFRPFFKGKTYGINESLPSGWTPEYVITAYITQPPKKYNHCVKEKEIKFRFKTYWTIYDCK